MARTAIPVCRKTLVSAIETVENNGPKTTMNILAEEAAAKYNGMVAGEYRHIAFSTVLLRIKEWNIPTKTVPGKRGRKSMTPEQKEAMRQGRTTRRKKGEKFAADPVIKAAFRSMREGFSKEGQRRFAPIFEKAENGSRSAAVAIKGLDCSAEKTADIRKCVCLQCPLWGYRPYQNTETNSIIMGVVSGRLPETALDGVVEVDEIQEAAQEAA